LRKGVVSKALAMVKFLKKHAPHAAGARDTRTIEAISCCVATILRIVPAIRTRILKCRKDQEENKMRQRQGKKSGPVDSALLALSLLWETASSLRDDIKDLCNDFYLDMTEKTASGVVDETRNSLKAEFASQWMECQAYLEHIGDFSAEKMQWRYSIPLCTEDGEARQASGTEAVLWDNPFVQISNPGDDDLFYDSDDNLRAAAKGRAGSDGGSSGNVNEDESSGTEEFPEDGLPVIVPPQTHSPARAGAARAGPTVPQASPSSVAKHPKRVTPS
jgi:hypothetical protein